VQRGGENAPCHQPSLLFGVAFQMAGNDPCHRLVAVAHKNLFAVPDEPNMSAQPRLQIADIDCLHVSIVTDVTMLVISRFLIWKSVTVERRIGTYSYALVQGGGFGSENFSLCGRS
jgi:hypothetical protein